MISIFEQKNDETGMQKRRHPHMDLDGKDKMQLILALRTETEKLDKEKAEKRLKSLAEYLKIADTANVEDIWQQLNLTTIYTPRIGEFLEAAGWSYRDLIEYAAGTDGNRNPCDWGTESQQTVCAAAEKMSKTEQKTWTALMKSILPVYASKIMDERYVPWQREKSTRGERRSGVKYQFSSLYAAIRFASLYSKKTRRGVSLGLSGKQQLADKNARALHRHYVRYKAGEQYFSDLPFWRIRYIIEGIGISPYWLLGLGQDDTVLAQTPGAEKLMSTFCMLPNLTQNEIARALNTDHCAKKDTKIPNTPTS